MMINFKALSHICVCLSVFFSVASHAAVTSETESNDDLPSANNVDAYFSTDYDSDIGDLTTNTSTTLPHVTITGALSSQDLNDYFSFTLPIPNAKVIMDIDYGTEGGFTCMGIIPYTPNQQRWGDAYSGGTAPTAGAGGSTSDVDPYIEYTFPEAGLYYIQVLNCAGDPDPGTYELQISVEGPVTPTEPVAAPIPTLSRWGLAAAALLLGLAALVFARKRTQSS